MNDEQTQIAQRRYFRAAVDFPVTVTAQGSPASTGCVVDLSSGGMRVCTKDEIAQGSTVTLRFTLPESTSEILVHGKIVLSFYDGSKGHFAHGIAFTQIAPADQDAITEHIHELQQRARA